MTRRFNFRRRRMPELDTTSTADISFMLLVFFLVTTSLDTDKGLGRKLPPPPDEKEERTLEVTKDQVLTLSLDDNDRLTCDGLPADSRTVRRRVMEFVAQRPDRHIIAIHSMPQTSYDAYFQLQHMVVTAYRDLREQWARKHYGRALKDCSADEREAVAKRFPQRIADTVGTGEGGER